MIVVIFAISCSSNKPTPKPSIPARIGIVFNADSSGTVCAKDGDAFVTMIRFIAGSGARAEYEALEIDNRIVKVKNGTRVTELTRTAEVAKGVAIARVQIDNGELIGRELLCSTSIS